MTRLLAVAAAVWALAANSLISQTLAVPTQTGYALVIGNNAYAGHPLRTPVSDASSVAELLRFRGYQVTLRTDVDQSAVEDAVREFRHGIAGTSLPVLFYFAGHGLQINGVNYLLPVRESIVTSEDVKVRTVSATTIFEMLGAASDRSPKIVILDACRPNPFGESSTLEWIPGFAPPVRAPNNSLVAFSTEPGNVAADGIGLHSPFARALLRRIVEPGVSIEQMFKLVRQDVEADVDFQHPTEFTLLTSKDFSITPALSLGSAILDGDDDVTVIVNGVEVADWNNDNRSRRTTPLHTGVNEIVIKVYNQRSYTGGLPLIGGHIPEGWRYHVVFDGPLPAGRLEIADREDQPSDNGPRHGKLFTAARFNLVVDARTLEPTIAAKVVGPWR